MKRFAIILMLFLCPYTNHGQDQHYTTREINKLKHDYYNATSDSAKFSALESLIGTYFSSNDFENTLLYYKQLKLLSEKLKTSKDQTTIMLGIKAEASSYFHIGAMSQRQGNYRQANNDYFRSLDLYKTIGDKRQVAIILSSIAATFSSMGNYDESLAYSFKALNVHEKIGDKKLIAIELNNIGAIYSDLNKHAKSLFYHVKAKNISQEIHNDQATAIYIGNIGHYYKALCDSAFDAGNAGLSLALQDTALYYFDQAVRLSETVGDIDNIAACVENIGLIHSNVGEHQQALPYYLRALDLYKKLGLQGEESYCYTRIGETYRGLGQTKKAEEAYAGALTVAKKTHSNYFLMMATMGNSEFYEKTGRPEKALHYYKEYVTYRDSLFNKESAQSLTRAEMNYEFDKKQAVVKFDNDKIVYKLESENKLQKQWRLFFICVIFLACAGLFFMKRAFDNKNKLAKILAEEDKRKEVLLQEVHHRINNNLQIISSLLTLQANSADNEKLTEYLTQSQHRIQSLSALHELLYDTNSPLEINMMDYTEKLLDFHRDVSGTLPQKIVIEIEVENVSFPTKLAVPLALIINELVTNSLKYAFKGRSGGLIKVALGRNRAENNWQVTISDNGNGLPEETERRKDSLGLKLVRIMTKQIGGTFVSENRNGAFFSVIFSLEKTH